MAIEGVGSHHLGCSPTRIILCRYAATNVQSVADPTPEQILQAKPFEDVPQPVNVKGPIGMVRGIYDAWKKDTFKRPHMATTTNFKQLGPIFKVQLANGDFAVHCMDTKDIEFVYHNDGKYPQRMHIEAWREYRRENNMPFGVLIDNGEAWLRQRNALSKRILRPLEIGKFSGIMNEVAQEMAAKIKQIRLGKDHGEKADLVEGLEIELNKWAMESKKYVDAKTKQIEDKKQRGEETDDGSYLAYLLEKGQLTQEEIYGNMTELLAASVDTTASTSMWMFHLLSRNPEVQEKLHREVMKVIPEDVHPTREQLDSMPYLKAVVKETLRYNHMGLLKFLLLCISAH
ncbi:1,25-dihydroxyvitamin D(3) 24-hydroxylase, mitochondrial-like [Amphiura filiformis]|uniref:1,25-dihydroxyvitamin D(3) 24-hydroxylase, mitochondrial-like n=1 Tax=Amphiura filiformis TaxID=82378 RepID=UPI003B20E179